MLPTVERNDYSGLANEPETSMSAPPPEVAPNVIVVPREKFSNEIWNLPNSLTLSRIFLVPFLVVVLLTKFSGREYAGLAIFLAAAATDFFDGYIARRRNQITRLGVLLDPIADKLLMSAAFISLVELQYAKAWMVVIIIGREFAVSGLRAIAAQQGVMIPASPLGKSKMVSEVIAVSLLILGHELGEFLFIGNIALWVVMIFALLSGIDYFVKFTRAVIKR